ncbi:MAG TPA: hypothetical protein VN736_27245 [Candidatus Limnocylindrales bacterium]|nr:hypothetical protein [Candidatus Limnocylindrales bacterium]
MELEPYDFQRTLLALDDLDAWLRSLGHNCHDRIRRYRDNIRQMLGVETRNEMELLQASISWARAREILWSYMEADEFVRAASALRRSFGDHIPAAPIERALQGPADPFLETAQNNAGRNFGFELVIAGRLAAAGLTPAFDSGPDISFDFAGLRVAVQCKRPLSSAGLEKNIGKAISQLGTDNADLKVLALSASRLVNAGDPEEIPEVENIADGHRFLDERLRSLARETERFWAGRSAQAAVWFYIFTPVRTRRPFGYHPYRRELLAPFHLDEFTRTMFTCLIQTIGV